MHKTVFHPVYLPSAHRQRGAVLEVTVILMLLLLMIGLAAVRGTFMQTKMSSNFYDREVAFQSAQAALRQGEAAVQSASSGVGSFRDCSPTATTPCLPDPFTDPNLPSGQIVTVGATSYNPSALAAGQPQYEVDFMGVFAAGSASFQLKSECTNYIACANTVMANYYRVTARSSNPATSADRAAVTLQSYYQH